MNNAYSELSRKDKQFIWHPFTQMRDWIEEEPLIIERGDGVYLTDVNGVRYIDGVSSLWTNVHGHRVRTLDRAIKNQLKHIAHSTFLGLSNVPAILLAEHLIKYAPPGMAKVFYADSGSEAVEIALKMAYQYWCQKPQPEPERTTFVHLTNSYHGDTLGSVSVGGIDLFHKIYKPLLFETRATPAPYCYRCPFGKEAGSCGEACLTALAETLEQHKGRIAAVVMEPLMQGAAGMIAHPQGFLARVRELTNRTGTLLICDEVATGFGRTGTLFACEQEHVTPDLMAVGKGITGGYLPLSATMTTQKIFDAFLGAYCDCKSFFHGHTYTGNQLATAVACANIELFREKRVLARLAPKIKRLTRHLKTVSALSHVGEVRQAGFMVGIELVKDRRTKEPYALEEKIGIRVTQVARSRGVIIRPLGNVIVLMPPLAITVPVLDELLTVVYEAIRDVTEKKDEACLQPARQG